MPRELQSVIHWSQVLLCSLLVAVAISALVNPELIEQAVVFWSGWFASGFLAVCGSFVRTPSRVLRWAGPIALAEVFTIALLDMGRLALGIPDLLACELGADRGCSLRGATRRGRSWP